MRIRQIPILPRMANYCHVVIDDERGVMAAVDPAEPAVVAEALAGESARLTHILCTHHHFDHAGGNVEMAKRFPGVEIVGFAGDAARIPGITRRVEHGDRVRIGDLVAEVLAVPCHTRGHIAYRFADPDPARGDALFCGDTLFVAGCGRFFEGDAAQMHHALNTVFAALPDDTRVYCGHEYTVANLEFARTVEPDNPAIAAKLAWARAERAAGRSTVPSTLGEEKTCNPFMRVAHESVQAATGTGDPVSAMAALRRAKDDFKG